MHVSTCWLTNSIYGVCTQYGMPLCVGLLGAMDWLAALAIVVVRGRLPSSEAESASGPFLHVPGPGLLTDCVCVWCVVCVVCVCGVCGVCGVCV